MHEGQPGLQALLCRDFRRALARHPGASVRAGLRSPPGAGEARGAVVLEATSPDLRQLDERPVPRRRARGVHPAHLRGHADGFLAHLSDPDQAFAATARARPAAPLAAQYVAGRVGRERALHLPGDRPSAGTGRRALPLCRALAGAHRFTAAQGDLLGHRRRRERSPASAPRPGMARLRRRSTNAACSSVLVCSIVRS